jgi:tetratricopeptide (TPR) repeat protein
MNEIRLRKKIELFLIFFLMLAVTAYSLSSQAREYLRKARVYFERGNLKDARDYFLRAQKIEPESEDIKDFGHKLQVEIEKQLKELRQRVDFFLNAKNIPEAEKIVRKLLVLNPDDEFGQKRISEIKQINQQIEEYQNKGIVVSEESGRTYDVEMYSAVSLLNRARVFYENGDRENALNLVEQVLAREPGYKPALELKDQILYVNRIEDFIDTAKEAFKEGRMRECIDSLNRLIEKEPNREDYILLRARAYLKLKRYKEAEKDLWKYYKNHSAETEQLFPLFSELYFGLERYDLALGFSADAKKGVAYMDSGFRFKCYLHLYTLEFSLMCFFMLLSPAAFFYSYKKFEFLGSRFPVGGLRPGLNLFWKMLVSTPEKYLPLLIEVARGLNTAWLNYYAGICLFRVGQYEGAQRFLAYSFTNDFIAGRAYYFYGLTRRLLNQELSNHDFEESVLSSLGKTGNGWHPEFVKNIERDILTKYSKEKSENDYEGMAYKLVKEQVGEKS